MGRARKYATNADRQRAYRAEKALIERSCYTPPHTVIGSPDRRFDHRFSGNFAENGVLARPHRGFCQPHACLGCRP